MLLRLWLLFEFMVIELCKHLQVDPPTFLHGFDVDKTCREALVANTSVGCVFGDCCGLFPPGIVKKAKTIQRRCAREAKHRVASGEAL